MTKWCSVQVFLPPCPKTCLCHSCTTQCHGQPMGMAELFIRWQTRCRQQPENYYFCGLQKYPELIWYILRKDCRKEKKPQVSGQLNTTYAYTLWYTLSMPEDQSINQSINKQTDKQMLEAFTRITRSPRSAMQPTEEQDKGGWKAVHSLNLHVGQEQSCTTTWCRSLTCSMTTAEQLAHVICHHPITCLVDEQRQCLMPEANQQSQLINSK